MKNYWVRKYEFKEKEELGDNPDIMARIVFLEYYILLLHFTSKDLNCERRKNTMNNAIAVLRARYYSLVGFDFFDNIFRHLNIITHEK